MTEFHPERGVPAFRRLNMPRAYSVYAPSALWRWIFVATKILVAALGPIEIFALFLAIGLGLELLHLPPRSSARGRHHWHTTPVHSTRSAVAGSTRVARLAGSQLASVAATVSTVATMAYAVGSNRLMP
jgi:hypothetical protein